MTGSTLQNQMATMDVKEVSPFQLKYLPRTSPIVTNASADINDFPPTPRKVVIPPLFVPPKAQFRLEQQWEGRVDEFNGQEIVATIVDLSDPTTLEEEIIFDLDEISKEDQDLVIPGAVFYWSIGYVDEPGRPRRKESVIRFRRLIWSKERLKEAREMGAELAKLFAEN